MELCETHISWVFLTGDYAYKIKKPVNFGFLDFSTLAKRKHFCEEEVRLNRRLAADIYLDVVPLCGDPEAPTVWGNGPLLEYAVRMRQFDPDCGFDRMLQRGELSSFHMDLAARTLAGFHAGIAIAARDANFGSPESVSQPVLENFDSLHRCVEPLMDDPMLSTHIAELEHWSINANRQLDNAFQNRKRQGFVRECHGDLHLRNIIYWQDAVVPFDCLEFEPNLRWIDVLNEMAFLLMDLDDHLRTDLARRLLNSYLEFTGDFDGLRVLRYYKVYRALVRAKVAGLRLSQLSNEDAARAEREAVGNYVALALRYVQASRGKLLITHGLSASGKSWLAQRLLEQVDLIRIRSDVERKRLFGLGPTEASASAADQGIYSTEATTRTYARLLQLAQTLIAAGYSVIVDATFLKRADRQAFADYAKHGNIPFIILHCSVPAETLRERIVARAEKGGDASEANLEILERQLQTQEPLSEEEKRYSMTMDSGNENSLEEILNWMTATV